MDTTGQILLGIAIITILCALIGFFLLSKYGPRGAVLCTAAVIYLLGSLLPAGNIREFHLIVGVLKFTGFIGGILGFVDLFKSKRRDVQVETIVDAEIVEEVESSELPPL